MERKNKLLFPLFNTFLALVILGFLIYTQLKNGLDMGLMIATIIILMLFMFVTWYLGYYRRYKKTKTNPTYEAETASFIEYWKTFSKSYLAEVPTDHDLSFKVLAEAVDIPHFAYDKETHSFGVSPEGTIPLLLATACIRLDIDLNTQKIVGVSGFSPCSIWYKKRLKVPNGTKGSLEVVSTSIRFKSNVAIRVSSLETTYYDKETGWICTGNYKTPADATVIELSEQLLIVLKEQQLVSCWLKVAPELAIYQ